MNIWKLTFGKSLPSVLLAVVVSTVLALLANATRQVLAADSTGEAGPITIASLLDDMTNLADMPEFPSPSYTCRQFSSYNRESKSPTEPGWFANQDRARFLRVEDNNGGREYVMMDAEGPGAIVRIWSANPTGTLRVYIDGADRPALETPLEDLLGGTYPGLPSPIAGVRAKGWNLYFPIPYAKHCTVTVTNNDESNGLFYHINYRTYQAGTKVVSFRNEQIAALEPELKALAAARHARRQRSANPSG
jgi:hypothetical protein